MLIGRILKLTIIGVGVLALGACSTTKGPEGTTMASSSEETFTAFSSALGVRGNVQGEASKGAYTTVAPHNQTYYFDYDNSTVHNEYLSSIQAQAKYVADHPDARVLIAGHTDERGSAEYNVALGERRADSVANLLRIAGVNSNQVRVVSYGQERPTVEGHDESAWKYNRRVEFIYENVG